LFKVPAVFFAVENKSDVFFTVDFWAYSKIYSSYFEGYPQGE